MSEEQVVVNQKPDFDVNEVQAQLTASKVLISILETLGQVTVPTKTLFEANNKDKELVVDYDEKTLSFIFRLPREEDMVYNAELIEENELINDFE